MKIFITGGAGFIGSALIHEIMASTNYTVINIDKLTYAGNLDSLPESLNPKKYCHEKVDICNYKEIENLFKKHKPVGVMHLAAESHVDRSIKKPEYFIDTNIKGTFNLLEASRKYFNNIDDESRLNFRFHHISTDEVYGDLGASESLFTEDTPYSPSSPYSASKAASDHLVRAWWRTFKLPIMITNCSNNYGPRQFPEKLIPNMILNAVHGKPLTIYGNGLQIRDWLYVEDHVKALNHVFKNGKIGETYNIGGDNQKTNIEVVNIICEYLENILPNKPQGIKNYHDLITFVKDRPGHDVRYAIDSSKIKHDLNWAPNETFETGLHKTINWYLDNRIWWEKVISGDYVNNDIDR